MNQISIVFQPYGKRIPALEGDNILEIAKRGGINIRSICGGKGSCGKCKVIVKNGETNSTYDIKENLLSEKELSQGYKLACLTSCQSNCEVLIPPESRIEGQKIISEATIPEVQLEPAIKKLFIPPQQLSGQSYEQLMRSFQIFARTFGISSAIFSKVRAKLDSYGKEGATLTIGTDEKMKLLDVEVGDNSQRAFGLALDVGTTKLVAYLVDLTDGKIIGVESDYNGQLMYGEDLVSRIGYTEGKKNKIKDMQRAVVETTNNLISRLISKYGLTENEILDLCAAGNTVMTYFLMGKDASMLLEPNIQIPRRPMITHAKSIGLNVNSEAELYCLPCVSRFLGGDAIGDVLLAQMYEPKELFMMIDIGTNVEAVLGGVGWFLSTTAAAGPAFEGWGIKFGMRSVEGAIDHVKIDPATLKSSYTVIGQAKPRGMCGSGLIDLMAEMFRNGVLDTFGKFDRKLSSPYTRMVDDDYEYVVAEASNTDLDRDITITEKDIANLIDSKAAACAATSIMMKKMNLSVGDIAKVFICGAFANYMDLNNAMAIGLLPEFPNAKITNLGNGSVAGAYLALVSRKIRKRSEDIASLVTYFDLLKDADFMDEYTAAYSIPGKRELFPTWWEKSRRK